MVRLRQQYIRSVWFASKLKRAPSKAGQGCCSVSVSLLANAEPRYGFEHGVLDTGASVSTCATYQFRKEFPQELVWARGSQ